MKLMSFKAALSATKKSLDDALIPIRVQQAKAQGNMEMLNIDEKLLNLEVTIRELTTAHPIKYDTLFDKMDEYDLLQRRKAQFAAALEDLFGDHDSVESSKGLK